MSLKYPAFAMQHRETEKPVLEVMVAFVVKLVIGVVLYGVQLEDDRQCTMIDRKITIACTVLNLFTFHGLIDGYCNIL